MFEMGCVENDVPIEFTHLADASIDETKNIHEGIITAVVDQYGFIGAIKNIEDDLGSVSTFLGGKISKKGA